MLKRLRWLFVGALLGVFAYLWLTNKAKQKVPEARRDVEDAARRAGGALRDVGDRLVEALREGKRAMDEREGELRREYLP
jgi:hypothetical protein